MGIWKAALMIFHVAQDYELNDDQVQHKKQLEKRLDTLDYSFHTVEIWNSIAEATSDFAAKMDADLIALMYYSHSFLEKLSREPVIRKIGFHSKVPILVLPDIGL